jgi:hypothetical protein
MSTTVVETTTEILLYSRKAAAMALSVSIRSIDYLIEDGRLPTRRLGKKVMIPAVPGSNVWWVEHYDSDGKRHRELAGTRATAIKLQAKRQADKLAQRKLPEMRGGKSILFQELVDDALEFSKQHHEDQRNVISRLKAISAALGSRPASSITPVDIKAFLAEKTDTPATYNRYKAAISLVFRVGIENGKVESNPARIVRQRKEDKGRIRFLTVSQAPRTPIS